MDTLWRIKSFGVCIIIYVCYKVLLNDYVIREYIELRHYKSWIKKEHIRFKFWWIELSRLGWPRTQIDELTSRQNVKFSSWWVNNRAVTLNMSTLVWNLHYLNNYVNTFQITCTYIFIPLQIDTKYCSLSCKPWIYCVHV